MCFRPIEQTAPHPYEPASLALLDHHRLPQVGRGALARGGQSPTPAWPGWGVPLAVGVQQGFGIVREVVTGEEGPGFSQPVFQGIYELSGLGPRPFPDPPGRAQFVNGIERGPNPSIALASGQLFQPRQWLRLLVDKGPQFIHLTFGERHMTEEVLPPAAAGTTDAGQAVTHRIRVALPEASARPQRTPFGQMANALSINAFRRPTPGLGRARPTGKPMTALPTLQAPRPARPARRLQPRAASRLTRPTTMPIPTVTCGQVHDGNSLRR